MPKTKVQPIHIRAEKDYWKPKIDERVDTLFNEQTFYEAFSKDVLKAKREVVIYSPFVTRYRADTINRLVHLTTQRNIAFFIFTRAVEEYDRGQQEHIREVLEHYEELGANVFYLRGSIHEKVAVIDREILWEGSLNILSQRTSREMMRRVTDVSMALQVMMYLGLNGMLAEGYRAKYERLYKKLMDGTKTSYRFNLRSVILGLAIFMVVGWILITWSGILNSVDLRTVLTLIKALTRL